MGLHERAWSGIKIGIFGASETLPMQIEQALATATPNNEVAFESFEVYEDAFDFCKRSKDVGLLIILENCGKLPSDQVFRELGKQYESRGWPCFGVLVYENKESFVGLRQLKNNSRLLDYISAEALLDPKQNSLLLSQIWNNLIKAFNDAIIPKALQESLIAEADTIIGHESIAFQDRVSQLLQSGLNVSWLETVALKWHPIVDPIQKRNHAMLSPHTGLKSISEIANPTADLKTDDFSTIIASKEPLVKRIMALTHAIDQSRQNSSLDNAIRLIATANKPGAPALLRHLVKHRDRILEFAYQSTLKVGSG